jgi:uncharacterized membrane protein
MHRPKLRERINEPTPAVLSALILAGHVCVCALVLLFLVSCFVLDQPPRRYIELILIHMAGGHLGTMTLGVKEGYPGWFLVLKSCLQDFMQMLYVYPLYVRYGYRHLLRWRVIGPWVKTTHETAMAHHKQIAPYGALGLFVFVVLPSPGSGPVIGSLIGYTLGLGSLVTLLSAGLPIVMLSLIYYLSIERAAEWNANAPTIMVYVILGIMLFSVAVAGLRFLYNVWKRGARAFDAAEGADDDSDSNPD